MKTFYELLKLEDLLESKVPVEARAFRRRKRRTVPTLNAPEEGGPTVLREAPRTLSQLLLIRETYIAVSYPGIINVPGSWTLGEYVGQRTAGSPPKPDPLSPSRLEVSSRRDEEGP